MCHQTEAQIEQQLLEALVRDDYTLVNITNEKQLLANLKLQLEKHNDIQFSQSEFNLVLNYLSGGSSFDKATKLRDRYALELPDGTTRHIEFLDSVHWCKNIFQVTHQVTMSGIKTNRYDVTILINGLPLVQIELKKRGIALSRAYLQMSRYRSHSFHTGYGLFGYIQIFVISNGTNTKYYASNPNPSFKQTFFWADKQNEQIRDIRQFTSIFLQRCHISKMICRYTVLSTSGQLMVLRPYQFYAIEAIVDKVANTQTNAYIWHTTGSGKTLTSFKAAQLLTMLDNVDKVVFVVDRKDLDTQTIQEFNKFKKGSVDGTDNTAQLVRQFGDGTPLVVTTIQKLNTAICKPTYMDDMKSSQDDNIVFIFDECHRSQFGQTHARIVRYFANSQLIGFTGTPIKDENHINKQTTAQLFDRCLHKYLIPDAISDENVLGFVVEYRVNKELARLTEELDKLTDKERQDNSKADKEQIASIKDSIKAILRSTQRVSSIVKHITTHHDTYTNNRFTAMMCVSDINMLVKYYDAFKSKQSHLKIAAIYSYGADDDDDSFVKSKDIATINSTDIDKRAKLQEYIEDYNTMFDTNFSTDTLQYDNYRRDIASRVKSKQIDLLIVVNMFLTGFDSPALNTLYVDKYLTYHGLIQAFSRTNRIYDQKDHGKIVCFRDLQSEVKAAVKLYSQKDGTQDILRDSFEIYSASFETKIAVLRAIAPTPNDVVKLKLLDQKLEFVKIFGSVLSLLNTLKTFIEFSWEILPITQIEIADYTSHYLDIYYELKGEGGGGEQPEPVDVDFELDLITSEVIDLLYILKLLFNMDDTDEKQKKHMDNIIRATPNLYKKQQLIEEFIAIHKASNGTIENIEQEYARYSDDKKHKAIIDFCARHKIDTDKTLHLIGKYIYDSKDIKSDTIADLFIDKLKFMDRVKKVPIVHTELMELIYKFESV